MRVPKFIAITDTTVVPARDMLGRARELCAACRQQSVMIQLRDRELGVRERLQLGEQLAGIAHDFDQTVCVNDRLDLAMLLGAQALHLGEGSVRARDIRERVGDRFWLTRALHEPFTNDDREADALILSPVCAARKGASALGMGAIRAVRKRVAMPIYALGGVCASNAADCIRAGATGVAAIGAWLASDSIESLVTALGIIRTT